MKPTTYWGVRLGVIQFLRDWPFVLLKERHPLQGKNTHIGSICWASR